MQLATRNSQPATRNPYTLHFAVKDTGIGIPANRLDRLFQSFSQLDPTTVRKYGGTGLGLAISKRLSEIMGGAIWVQSEVGRGSTFHFTIRALEAPSPDLAAGRLQLAGKRLLIVDDNALNRRMLSVQVQQWGMAISATASGAEALDWLQRGDPFDVALIDMHMPEMDGLTLAEEIRRMEAERAAMVEAARSQNAAAQLAALPPLPLVLLTSLGQHDGAPRPVQSDFHAVLHKPLKLSQLHDVLAGIFEGQLIQADPAPPAAVQPAPNAAPLRILVAEDDVISQKLMPHLLRDLGCHMTVVGDGEQVLAALEREPHDIVLLDIHMPNMSGIEVAQEVCRRWPPERRPYMIALTASAMQGDRERCLASGMHDYITKPVRIEELLRAITGYRPYAASASVPAPPDPTLRSDAGPEDGSPVARSDLDRLQTMAGAQGTQLLAQLIESYLAEAPVLLERMRAAEQAHEAAQLAREAHKLKASSGLLGARALAQLCAELEEFVLGTTADERRALLDRAIAEFALARPLLEQELKAVLLSPHR
jgi:CheY-like chemotaxis protein/HPt (histidine-containing phosphotransfer) domain-containing protein